MPSSQTCMNIKASRPRAITGWPFFLFIVLTDHETNALDGVWPQQPLDLMKYQIDFDFFFFFLFYTTVVICNGFVSSWFRFTIMSSLLIFIDSIRKKWYSTDIFYNRLMNLFCFPNHQLLNLPFFFFKSFEIDIYVHIERQFIIFSCVWWGLSF